MPTYEHVPASLEEVISEIATILARGYMRHRNGRRLAPEEERALDRPPKALDSNCQ